MISFCARNGKPKFHLSGLYPACRITPGILSVIIALSILPPPADAQQFVDVRHLSVPFDGVWGTQIFLGPDKTLHITGEGISEWSIAGSTYGSTMPFDIVSDSLGASSISYFPDTAYFNFGEFSGESDFFARAAAIDSGGAIVMCCAKQHGFFVDVPPFEIFQSPELRVMRKIGGETSELFRSANSSVPAVAVGSDGTIHFAWEEQSPLHDDSNYVDYSSIVFYRSLSPGGSLSQPYVVGKGFSPRIVPGNSGAARIFWLKADSASAELFNIMTMRFTGGTATLPATVQAFTYLPLNFDAASDTLDNVSVVWSEDRAPSGKRIFYVRYHAPVAVVDSSARYSNDTRLVVANPNPAGQLDLAWTGGGDIRQIYFNRVGPLPPFASVDSFSSDPLPYATAGSLIERPDGGVGCVYASTWTRGLGYRYDVRNAADTNILVPGYDFIAGSTRPAVRDGAGMVWVIAGRPQPTDVSIYDPFLLSFSGRTTGVAERRPLPAEFFLGANYPNPFNPATTISYGLASRSHVVLAIFDLLGREVARLVDDVKPAGTYTATFNAANFPSGIYFCRLRAGDLMKTTRIALVK